MKIDDDEYGPWIDVVPGLNPVKEDDIIMAQMNNDVEDIIGPIPAGDFDWDHLDQPTKYRLKLKAN